MLRVALLTIVVAAMSSAMGLSLNLAYGTVGGAFVCGQTFDELVVLLGRPSAVVPQRQYAGRTVGPELLYHAEGLNVSFHPGESGQKRVQTIGTRLSSSWDDDYGRSYSPFSGRLEPSATGRWRSPDVLPAVAQLNPVELTPDDLRAEFIAMGIPASVVPVGLWHEIRVHRGRCMLYFQHEPITRFLEQIALNCLYDN